MASIMRASSAAGGVAARLGAGAPTARLVPAVFARASFFSSDARKASERVHGELRSDQVGSKAMRKRLAAAEREESAANAPVVSPPPPPPLNYEAPPPQEQGGGPTSFGQVLKANFVSGIGIALGFMLIAAVLRSIGLEGGVPSGGRSPSDPRERRPSEEGDYDGKGEMEV
jgi:hypothetical protein